jgi:hypothetical protein
VVVAVSSRGMGLGSGRVIDGDPDVRNSHLYALWPTKKVLPGSIYRVMCSGGDLVTVLVNTPSLKPEQMLEVAAGVHSTDSRWKKQDGPSELYTWYLLEQAAEDAGESENTQAA